jgi:C4-dicarboxylate transporter, DctM subunit
MTMFELTFIGYLGILLLLVLLVFGLHIGVALGLVGMLGTGFIVGWDGAFSMASSSFYHQIQSYELLTVPLFILMGFVSAGGGVSKDIYDTLALWLRRLRGGLGIATAASCTAFGAISGSSLVSAVVFTKLAAPEMRNHGYDKRLAYGICSSSSIVGMLIPPSILMVVYGSLSGESIGRLLIAGIVPGLMCFVLFSIFIMAIGWIKPSKIQKSKNIETITLRVFFRSLVKIWQVVVVALIIFGGIFAGVFTPTEAAAVSSVVIIALTLITKLHQSKEILKKSFLDTASTTGMVFLILGGASVFSHFLTLSGITQNLTQFIVSLNLSKYYLLWALILFYILLGCLMDSISILCITIPLLNPIIDITGIDPIYYAVLIVMALEAGLMTPPVGMNVYGSFAVAEKDVSLEDIFIGVFPFLIAVIMVIIVLMYFSVLGTFLPELMLGK